MAKEIFKNLPNQSTPLSASKLNGLFDGEESMGSIVVEDVICKNLFDKNNYNLVHFLFANDVYTTTSSAQTIYIEVEPNTTYTITKNYWNDGSLSLATSSDVPVSGGAINQTKGTNVTSDTNNYITITTGANDNYLAIYLNWGTTGLTETLNKLQIEKGSVSTDYVEHKEFSNKQIYSTNEQVIGTWIDGKPLYRKIIDYGTLPNTTTRTLEHNISNVDIFTKVEGIANDGVTFLPLPYAHSNVVFNVVLNTTKTNVSIATNSDRTTYTKTYITLEYTKTTD